MKFKILFQFCCQLILLIIHITDSSDLAPTHAYGLDTKLSGSKLNKIIAGIDTVPGEFPWQVSLQILRRPLFGTFHFCGGSILDEMRILTAAHCMADFNSTADTSHLQIHAGIQKRSSLYQSSVRQISGVERIIMHPHFDKDNANNDLAILVLSTPLDITSNNFVRALRLPPAGHTPRGTCEVSGWGFQSPENGISDRFSDTLKKASVDIVDRDRCNEIYRDVNPVTDNMICAGKLKEGMATCIGDSGSPVTCYDLDDKNPYLAGIVSWGINPCGHPNYPSVFSNVASLRSFVDSVIYHKANI